MRILAIETSAQPCSVALADGASVVQRQQSSGSHVAEQALSMIAQLLAEQSIALSQVDAFAFGSGPGAFTGLRVACALVQGFAFANGRPVIPVESLRALAYGAGVRVRRSHDDPTVVPPRVLAAIDARMGQIYWAVYEGARGERRLAGPALAEPDQVAALVQQWQPQLMAGDGLRTYKALCPAPDDAVLLPDLFVDARMVAELARTDLAAGRFVAARDAAPEYVRDQVALTVAQRTQGAAS